MTRLRSWLVVAMVPLFSGSDGRLACLFCAAFVGAAKEERFLRAMRGVVDGRCAGCWMCGAVSLAGAQAARGRTKELPEHLFSGRSDGPIFGQTSVHLNNLGPHTHHFVLVRHDRS